MDAQRRRNHPQVLEDIPPMPEMPPIEALDFSPSRSGNTVTSAAATSPNIALSKRRSQPHNHKDHSASRRAQQQQQQQQQQQHYSEVRQQQAHIDGSAQLSQSQTRNTERYDESAQLETASSQRAQPHTLPRERHETRKPTPPRVALPYLAISPPSHYQTSPTEVTPSPTNFPTTIMNSFSRKYKSHDTHILPMGTSRNFVFWQEQEAQDKLRMLCAPADDTHNASAFDEIVEFGFPVDVQSHNDVGFGTRQMTLHVTLSPAAMRDRDEVLYGWQKELANGTINSSNPTVDDMSSYNYTNSNTEDDLKSRPPIATTGTGGMKRVFGKLKKKPPANSSIMITSADVE